MPNYRYQSPEYMNIRRGNCARSCTNTQGSCQMQHEPSCQMQREPSCQMQREPICQPPREPACQEPEIVCCNDKGSYDELRGMPLAMAYVPWQEWCDIYEADKGFCHGTIFKELNKPFRGTGGCCK